MMCREHAIHKMAMWRAAIVACVLMIPVAGCVSARSSVGLTSPPVPAEVLEQYSTVAVRVEPKVEMTDDNVRDLAAAITSQLLAIGQFTDVRGARAEDSAGMLVLQVAVTKFRRVGGVSRFFFGRLAGTSSTEAQVELIDAESGRVLGTLVATGESNMDQAGSSATDSMTAQLAQGIARGLSAILNPKRPRDPEIPEPTPAQRPG